MDLLIKGGTVIDPMLGLHAVRDVAVNALFIQVISRDIPIDDLSQVI